MALSVSTAKSELEGILHGTTTNQITNLNGVFNRAARQLLLDIDPQETKRIVQLTNPIYDKVYDYVLPSDLKGNKIIDIRPQVSRVLRDRYEQLYNQDFDLNKDYNFQPSFTINFNSSVKTVRINAPLLNTGITMEDATSPTGNGTWAGDGVYASNLSEDDVDFVSGVSSIKFDLASGGNPITAYLQNSTFSAVDLSTHSLQSSIFYYVYLPTASNFTSVSIRWGTDSSNYYTSTQTSDSNGNTFQNGWNLLKADWSSATKVNNPTDSSVGYLRVSFVYNGTAMNGAKINNIVSRLGKKMEIEYYSKFLFRNVSTGAFQETVLDDSDLINLDTETYNIYLSLVTLYSVQQALGQDATYDTDIFMKQYKDGLERYRGIYKSEVIKPKTQWYRKPTTSWRRFFGRGFNYVLIFIPLFFLSIK